MSDSYSPRHYATMRAFPLHLDLATLTAALICLASPLFAAEPVLVRTIHVNDVFAPGLTGMAVDDGAGRLYVADRSNHRIVVTDLAGEPVTIIGQRGSGPGQFETPADLQITTTGELLVVDWMNFRVQVLGLDGTFIRQWGSRGSGPGEFEGPVDVAVDPSGFVYVMDSSLSRVQKFNLGGQYLKTWASPGTGIAATPSGEIVVADQGNNRLQFFTAEGGWLRTIDLSAEPARSQPAGVHVDASGQIFVAGWDGTALCLSPEGQVLLNWKPLGAWARVTTDAAGLIYLAGTHAEVYIYAFPTAVQSTTWSAVKSLID